MPHPITPGTPCAGPDCDRILAPYAKDGTPPPPGMVRHHSRGLCSRCLSRARIAGTRDDYAPLLARRADLLEAWDELTDLDPPRWDESHAARCRRLAPRIGTTPAALEKALQRAGRRSGQVAA